MRIHGLRVTNASFTLQPDERIQAFLSKAPERQLHLGLRHCDGRVETTFVLSEGTYTILADVAMLVSTLVHVQLVKEKTKQYTRCREDTTPIGTWCVFSYPLKSCKYDGFPNFVNIHVKIGTSPSHPVSWRLNFITSYGFESRSLLTLLIIQ